MALDKTNRVLVTGGGTYLGINIASALLAEGADVTLLIREGNQARLGILETRVRWFTADVWDAASLKGRARGHGAVIHTVGSMVADPSQGLTYHRLNVISARNAANMCITDGVGHFVLMSSPYAPWVGRQYVHAKREAEAYVRRVGLKTSVIRAPLTYVRGAKRPFFYRLMTLLAHVPPLSLALRRIAPMRLDIVARAVARVALTQPTNGQTLYRRDLRRLNTRDERRGRVEVGQAPAPADDRLPFELLDDDTPFGWMPPTPRDEE